MDDQFYERLARIEAIQSEMQTQLAEIRTGLKADQAETRAEQADIRKEQAAMQTTLALHGEQLSRIKGTLGRLEPMIIRILSDMSELHGQLKKAPTARDFGHLEGRLDEISARLPVPLAYQPPENRRQGGSGGGDRASAVPVPHHRP